METMLTMDEFRVRFGAIYAASENGNCHVTSALTKHHYIYYDHVKKEYVVERR